MKPRWWIVGAFALVLGVSAAYLIFKGPAGREAAWYPDRVMIADLEVAAEKANWSGQSLGTRQRPIAEYARFYFGTMYEQHRMIEGELVLDFPNYKKGVHIVRSDNEMPSISDGGCSIVHVIFDADAKHINSIECNGLA